MDELTPQFPYELGGDLKYVETIDHGSFGTIIHVIEISSNKDMAVKVINKSGEKLSMINKMKEEISILKQINHENIVKFYGFFETNNQLLIKMEYIKYGTLSHWIKNHKKISEEEASLIISKILSAIVYLHSKQICHRDIKPENIMLSKENDLSSIKIVDFGLSAQNFDKLINNDYCGTYIYMAPEQIEKKLYFISIDIWSIGILMYILLNNGKHPFYDKGDKRKEYAKKIKEGKIYFYNKISPMAKHLILKLLEPNPSWRYTAAQAIKHPWITRNKNNDVPLTFNEILIKSNYKKIMKDLFNISLFMNYFSKKRKYKFNINKEYIFNCNLYDQRIKQKINKKKERCLDIISTDEDDSNSKDKIKIKIKKNCFPKRNNRSYSMHYKKRNSSVIISSYKGIFKNKKIENRYNDLKTKKVTSLISKKYGDKNKLFNFKKLIHQKNAISNKKIITNRNQDITKINIVKTSSLNLLNNFKETITKEFPSKKLKLKKDKIIQNDNVINISTENIKVIKNNKRQIDEQKNDDNKENKKYLKLTLFSSKKIRCNLPYILPPNCSIYLKEEPLPVNPLILPNICKIKKEKDSKHQSFSQSLIKKSKNGINN